MDQPTIQNILIFMERVQVQGKESLAWCQAYSALQDLLEPKTTPEIKE